MKKILLSTAIAASLVATSTAVFAAVPTTGTKAVSTSKVSVSTTVKDNSKGNIDYVKKTLFNADGSTAAVQEAWADPVTGNERLDYSEAVKGTNTLNRVEGCYVLDNGTKYIKATKDANGNLTGISMKVNNANSILRAEKQDYINEYKEGTRRAGWNDEGIVKTADRTELNKLSRTDRSNMPGEEGISYVENVYLDKSSGLPVKGDLNVVQNGKTSLLYTYVYEYNKVSDDGSLFSTQGINIEKMN